MGLRGIRKAVCFKANPTPLYFSSLQPTPSHQKKAPFAGSSRSFPEAQGPRHGISGLDARWMGLPVLRKAEPSAGGCLQDSCTTLLPLCYFGRGRVRKMSKSESEHGRDCFCFRCVKEPLGRTSHEPLHQQGSVVQTEVIN